MMYRLAVRQLTAGGATPGCAEETASFFRADRIRAIDRYVDYFAEGSRGLRLPGLVPGQIERPTGGLTARVGVSAQSTGRPSNGGRHDSSAGSAFLPRCAIEERRGEPLRP